MTNVISDLDCGSGSNNTASDDNYTDDAADTKQDDDEYNNESCSHFANVLSVLVLKIIPAEASDALLCVGTDAAS